MIVVITMSFLVFPAISAAFCFSSVHFTILRPSLFTVVNPERYGALCAQLLNAFGQLLNMKFLSLLEKSLVEKRQKNVYRLQGENLDCRTWLAIGCIPSKILIKISDYLCFSSLTVGRHGRSPAHSPTIGAPYIQ